MSRILRACRSALQATAFNNASYQARRTPLARLASRARFSSLVPVSAPNQSRSSRFSKFLYLAGALGGALYLSNRNQTEACGIVGFVGKEPAINFLLEGLHILQNRGYDSAGVATIHENSVNVTKFASVGSTSDSIQLLSQNAPSRHPTDTTGIAHTRWATHGGKTNENAHPHVDRKNRLALVHNGTIENSSELRAELEREGIVFRSQTDTEVIVQLIGHNMDRGLTLMEAVKSTLQRLEGTWGIALISRDHPDQIIAARNGSPLVVGIGKEQMFVASEFTAFSRHTNEYISLHDGEVVVIKSDGSDLDLSRVELAPKEDVQLDPSPYPHWTIKEIMEQPAAISRALNLGGRLDAKGLVKLGGLEANREMLLNIRNLIIAACGTSYYASLYGAQLMRSLSAFDTVQPIDAAELSPDFLPSVNPGLLVVSQSGETKDVHRALTLAQSLDVPSFSVINSVGSLIARTTKCGVYINAGREHAVASTKAFTTQVTVMALIAAWFAQNRQAGNEGATSRKTADLVEALHILPTYTSMALKTRDQCKEIADRLAEKQHIFLLGKGLAEPIAREGALKIKEITYTHAEGFPGGSLKHGPFALIDQGTPVILMIFDDQHASLMNTAAQEVSARGAHTIIITDNPKIVDRKACHDMITIPSNGPLTPLLAAIPLQLLAYELAIKKGIQPDKPRNLAKAVTVD